ncbi:aspartate ammonia-lyase [Sphingomonas sp. CCH21-G11]|uniref:aspartate ammonia-lyase n=1 Tax=Sphingomonas sp. CCH21-G11 TaxID=1768749 RepID=UPI000AAB1E93|nr:aspartate ammonia-lyase [Sphingomonas sp. CCH21-G11]
MGSDIRLEHDPLGPVEVPAQRLYGAQTVRALRNFPISSRTIAEMPTLIVALARVKKAAARANLQTDELDAPTAEAIAQACDEIIAGEWHHEFVVDVFQGGAGTSTNMNMNEVLANRALVLLGHSPGDHRILSPNDHVNRSQSTNDVYATAVRLAVFDLNGLLMKALARLEHSFRIKSKEFAHVRKLGRTQLQDAVPMTLGEEFGAFAATLQEDSARAAEVGRLFLEVNMGGTAIGTGIGANAGYAERIVDALREVSGLHVTRAANLIEATWDMGAFVFYSGFLKRVASKLSKISNDLRLLSSGPRGGLGEIRLPERQPGSSIMPGKLNPVMPEAMNQVAFRVFGADTTITFAAEAGQLQLNAFEPIIMWSIHESVDLLIKGMDALRINCVDGIIADEAACRENLLQTTALATALVPHLGYARCAVIAKAALDRGVDLRTSIASCEPDSLALFDRLTGAGEQAQPN